MLALLAQALDASGAGTSDQRRGQALHLEARVLLGLGRPAEAESAARQQWEIEQRRKLVVGVNEFVTDEPELSIPTLKIGEEADREQRQRMAEMRAKRDNTLVASRLNALRDAARGTTNVVPFILDCARAYCTLYEIRAALEDVFGAYREPVFF